MLIYAVIFVLKYVFASPNDAFLAEFKNSKHFIRWVILSEFIIASVLYKYARKERVKDLIIVSLLSLTIITFALSYDVLGLQGSPTGDHRFYMAQSQKILEGHWPWESPFYLGELTPYPYLYFTIAAVIYSFISTIYTISLGKFYILLGVAIRAISPFVMYWTGKRMFNRYVGLIAAFSALLFFGRDYWAGPHWISVMLTALAVVWFYEGKYLRSGLALGMIIHVYYLHAFMTSLAMILYRLFVFYSVDEEGISKNLRVLARTFLAAELVSLPFTLPLILKYLPGLIPVLALLTILLVFFSREIKINATISEKKILALGVIVLLLFFIMLPLATDNLPGRSVEYTADTFFKKYNSGYMFKGLHYNNSLYFRIFLVGLIAAFLRREKNHLLLLSWFTAAFVVMYIYVLTFFNAGLTQFMRVKAVAPVFILLSSIAFYEVASYLYENMRIKTDKNRFLRIGVIALVILWAPAVIDANLNPPRLWRHWEEPDNAYIIEQMDWIKGNTDPDDVIFSGWDYANTYIVPFTGRKVILARPSYHNLFVDSKQRASDYEYMYTGSNFTRVKEMFIKYNVKYAINRRPTKHLPSGKGETVTDQHRRNLFKHKEFRLIKKFTAGDIYEFVPTADTARR